MPCGNRVLSVKSTETNEHVIEITGLKIVDGKSMPLLKTIGLLWRPYHLKDNVENELPL